MESRSLSVDRLETRSESDDELDESVSNLIRDSLMKELTPTQKSQSSLNPNPCELQNPNLTSRNSNLPSHNLDLQMDTTTTSTESQNYLALKVNEAENVHDHGPNLPFKKVKTAGKRTIIDSQNGDGGASKSRHTENSHHPSTHETLKPSNRYSRHNRGPYTVEIDCICNPPIQVLSLGKILHKNFKDEVTDCKKKRVIQNYHFVQIWLRSQQNCRKLK